ncbi:SEC-C motif-containing protein [Chryseobacterium sp. SORGH_AS 447]|uniref:YchJ family protein n=1 Tax=Chryseobacterium sp. SORGH_AS_0447 TaxID=3041769 RepID=UPI002782680C|nr:YchJ family protein [Chryseobacterium sp. SORGH_AS_0447]MDQ1163476.1 SEC-C motif-containing protein [Chryseobacterium sp. SORGH_AS_0447]
MNCPCCSGNAYEDCCQPYHTGEKNAPTAEALMRSRFSAFAIPNGDYLMETTLPSKRKYHNRKDLQEWGEINTWTKLEIVDKPSANKVEFKAFYTDENGDSQIHHELSTFKMIQNRWFYVSGIFLE